MSDSPRSPQWQPIETAPKDRTMVLLHTGGGCAVGSFYVYPDMPGGGYWSIAAVGCIVEDDTLYDPTHWMPLPDPPKE